MASFCIKRFTGTLFPIADKWENNSNVPQYESGSFNEGILHGHKERTSLCTDKEVFPIYAMKH
jgi:hypothetical protein